MMIINNNILYEEQDTVEILYRLSLVAESDRDYMKNCIISRGYDIDTPALLNIISNPIEYNIDYLYSLDSAVTDKFIMYMEEFGVA